MDKINGLKAIGKFKTINWIKVLLAMIVLFAFGCLSFYVGQKFPINTNNSSNNNIILTSNINKSPSPSVNLHSDWDTFYDKAFDISIQYPPNWTVISGYTQGGLNTYKCDSNSLKYFLKNPTDCIGTISPPGITLQAKDGSATIYLEGPTSGLGGNCEPPDCEEITKNITIDDKSYSLNAWHGISHDSYGPIFSEVSAGISSIWSIVGISGFASNQNAFTTFQQIIETINNKNPISVNEVSTNTFSQSIIYLNNGDLWVTQPRSAQYTSTGGKVKEFIFDRHTNEVYYTIGTNIIYYCILANSVCGQDTFSNLTAENGLVVSQLRLSPTDKYLSYTVYNPTTYTSNINILNLDTNQTIQVSNPDYSSYKTLQISLSGRWLSDEYFSIYLPAMEEYYAYGIKVSDLPIDTNKLSMDISSYTPVSMFYSKYAYGNGDVYYNAMFAIGNNFFLDSSSLGSVNIVGALIPLDALSTVTHNTSSFNITKQGGSYLVNPDKYKYNTYFNIDGDTAIEVMYDINKGLVEHFSPTSTNVIGKLIKESQTDISSGIKGNIYYFDNGYEFIQIYSSTDSTKGNGNYSTQFLLDTQSHKTYDSYCSAFCDGISIVNEGASEWDQASITLSNIPLLRGYLF